MKRLLLGVISSLLAMNAYALTIDEAVMSALEKDYSIKSQQENVKAANLVSRSAYLIFFPTIQASYNYTHSTNERLNSGGSVESESGTLGASASLNIFKGFQDVANMDIAYLNTDVANLTLDTKGYDTMLNTQNAFINVLKAKQEYDLAMQNLELLNLQLRDAKLSADNGLIAKNDLLEVETYVASAELQRIATESGVKIALRQLENVMNTQLTDDTTFIEPELILLNDVKYETLEELMLANRSDLKTLDKNYEMSEANETLALSPVYPRINVVAGYNMYGDSFSPFTGGNSQGYETGMTYGITASWEIVSAAASIYNEMSKSHTTQALAYTIAGAKQSLELGLRTALQSYTTSQAQLAQSEIAIRSAEENYRVTNSMYQQSMATMTDLLDATILLNQAKIAESNAKYSVIASVFQIERLIEMPVEDIEKEQK